MSVRPGSMASTPATSRAHGAAARPPVRIVWTCAGLDARGLRELRPCAGEEPGRERLVAEDGPGLDRADRVAPDDPVRRAQLDARELRRPCGERLEPELEARGDRPADERAVGSHAVERRRRAEVHHDRGRAVQPDRGERIDDPVRRRRGPAGRGGSRSARCPPTRRGPGCRGAPRRPRASPSAPGRPTRRTSPRRRANACSSSASRSREEDLQLVGGLAAPRARPAGRRRSPRPPRARA